MFSFNLIIYFLVILMNKGYNKNCILKYSKMFLVFNGILRFLYFKQDSYFIYWVRV